MAVSSHLMKTPCPSPSSLSMIFTHLSQSFLLFLCFMFVLRELSQGMVWPLLSACNFLKENKWRLHHFCLPFNLIFICYISLIAARMHFQLPWRLNLSPFRSHYVLQLKCPRKQIYVFLHHVTFFLKFIFPLQTSPLLFSPLYECVDYSSFPEHFLSVL